MNTKTKTKSVGDLFAEQPSQLDSRISTLWEEKEDLLRTAERSIGEGLRSIVSELASLLDAARTKLVEEKGAGAWEDWLAELGIDPAKARTTIRVAKAEGSNPLQLALKLSAEAKASTGDTGDISPAASWIAKATAGFFRRSLKQPAEGWDDEMRSDLRYLISELITYAKKHGVTPQ